MPHFLSLPKRALVIISLSVSTQVMASEVIYSWVDANGLVHYSQQPPANDIKFTQVYNDDIEPQKSGYVSAPTKQPTQSTAAEIASAEALLIKAKDPAQAKMLCELAQEKLKLLNSQNRLTRKDSKSGEQVTLSDQERATEITTQQQRIDEFCPKA
ncbi:MAG: DUF4124 domain-containing protein [Shewanella sp.]|uniref:DUF4124 domain-containing protein n=1 Tax=Shewanella sp. SNU WT4 TaxID=2590015 RepID=UPI00112DAD4E|nr:DUF4124 domain-containing protein [Shewanella sp. SNU WT4]QDF67947.1 DUF4124 domain-containing protein [Shewanella sp. SNU WT4]